MTGEPDTGEVIHRPKSGRAGRVLRVIAAVLVTAAGILAAWVSATAVLDHWGTALGDLLGVGEDAVAITLLVLLPVPVAMLSGLIARPYWWAPALPSLLLAAGVFCALAAWGGGDAGLLAWICGGNLVVTGLSGFLGSRLAARHRIKHIIIGVGTVWLGAMAGIAVGCRVVFIDVRTAAWAALIGLQVGLAVAWLTAYRMPDSERRGLLRVGMVVWWLSGVGAAGGVAWLNGVGDLEWYLPWVLGAGGAAALSLLGYAACAVKGSRLRGRLALAPVLIAINLLGAVGLMAWVGGTAPGLAVGDTAEGTEETQEAYFRLGIAGRSTVYLGLRGNELRVAASPEELEAASVMKASAADFLTEFEAFDLPVPAEDLPAGCTGVKASIRSYVVRWGLWGREVGQSMCLVSLGFLYRDPEGAEWGYWTEELQPEASASPGSAAPAEFPAPGALSLRVEARPGRDEGDTVGLAVIAQAGDLSLRDIQRKGRSVKALLEVEDRGGGRVASTAGTLAELGFT